MLMNFYCPIFCEFAFFHFFLRKTMLGFDEKVHEGKFQKEGFRWK